MAQTISINYRIKATLTLLFFFIVGYGFTNRFPLFTPTVVPSFALDDWFGFHSWAVWFYISDYILIFMPAILVTRKSVLKQIMKGYFLNFAIHFPIFFFFPTTVPRHPLIVESFTDQVFAFIRMIDAPFNCFPSQHVSLVYVIAFSFWHYRRKTSIVFFIWATLIALSTMATKQHYVLDVLGGIFVALVVCWVTFRKGYRDHTQLVSPTQ